jgi:hypothetical protein
MGAEILVIWAATSPRTTTGAGVIYVGLRGGGVKRKVIQVQVAPSFGIPVGLFVFERLSSVFNCGDRTERRLLICVFPYFILDKNARIVHFHPFKEGHNNARHF